LTNGEFKLLAALQRILTRDQLLEASRVYDNEVYDRSIDVQVLRLRRKIEPNPSQPRLLSRNAVWATRSTLRLKSCTEPTAACPGALGLQRAPGAAQSTARNRG
jgi:hypothetical protein